MKLIADLDALSAGISEPCKISPSRSSQQTYTHILLSAKNGILTVEGTDGEAFVKTKIRKVEIETEGEILVGSSQFKKIIDNIRSKAKDAKQVSIEYETRFTIKVPGKRIKFTLNTLDARTFPESPKSIDGGIEISAPQIQTIISKTQHSSAVEKTRFAMNGMFLTDVQGKLGAVTTDGRRMAFVQTQLPVPDEFKDKLNIVIPYKGMTPLNGLEETDKVFLNLSENMAHFRSQSIEIQVRLVEGHFPPYQNVIPKPEGISRTIKVKKQEFLDKIALASLMTTRESATLKFVVKEDSIDLYSRSVDAGDAAISITDFELDGDQSEMAVGFNPEFLRVGVNAISADELTFKVGNAKTAGMVEDNDPDFALQYVLMPINLGEDD